MVALGRWNKSSRMLLRKDCRVEPKRQARKRCGAMPPMAFAVAGERLHFHIFQRHPRADAQRRDPGIQL
ncbi:MAG: hypothetical protein AB1586_19640 [Pseudomonadota bacterium]